MLNWGKGSRGRAKAKAVSCPDPEEAGRAGEADGMETWKTSRPELHHPPSRTAFIPSEGAGSLHPQAPPPPPPRHRDACVQRWQKKGTPGKGG